VITLFAQAADPPQMTFRLGTDATDATVLLGGQRITFEPAPGAVAGPIELADSKGRTAWSNPIALG